MEKKLIIANEITEILRLKDFVDNLGERLSLSEDLVFSLNLVLEEAVINVIQYAYPQDEDHTIELTAEQKNEQLVFTLKDVGIPFDSTKVSAPDTDLAMEDRQIGGLGIYFVRQLMDEVTYKREDGMNVLTMYKKIKKVSQ